MKNSITITGIEINLKEVNILFNANSILLKLKMIFYYQIQKNFLQYII